MTPREFCEIAASAHTDTCMPWPFATAGAASSPQLRVGGKTVQARRYVWTLTGPLTTSESVMLSCAEPLCVNRQHMRLVPRGAHSTRSTCREGHEYTDDNTRTTPSGRRCRTCEARSRAKSYDRKSRQRQYGWR